MTIHAQSRALTTLIADRWPNRLEHVLAQQLTDRIPATLAAMTLVASDGYPTSTPGAHDRNNGGRGTSELTSVEAAVMTRTRPTGAYSTLSASVAVAAVHLWHSDRGGLRAALKAALRITDQWQPPADPKLADTLRCAGTVPDSDWIGRADCTNIADGGTMSLGLCVRCRRAYNRHEREVRA